ncbi:MAG: hypothetical protein ACRCX2_28355 [Paraclostridium sp.]
MATTVKKVNVKSKLNGVLIHNEIEVGPFEIVSVSESLGRELVETGYCELVKVKEV